MSVVLTLRVKVGNGNIRNSEDVAKALEQAASRVRINRYVETIQKDGGEITRAVLDTNCHEVGAFTLQESPT